MLYETNQVNQLTVNIYRDEDPANPREAFGNLGTMVCFHPKYTLGDEHDYPSPEDFLNHLTHKALTPEQIARWNRIQDLIDRIPGYYCNHTWGPKAIYMDRYYRLESELAQLKEEALSNYILIPLYLYDHSGITMRTSSFSCGWDSGQVGWIYVTVAQAHENWPELDLLDLKGRAARYLEGEVNEYDMYLTGDCWGYAVVDEIGDELGTCWGFYGLDTVREEAFAHARSIADALPKQHELSL